MDEDFDDQSERGIVSDDDEDEYMLRPGSSGRGRRMSGLEETMFELR